MVEAMTRTVLFDLDGTLTDTVPLIAEHLSGALVSNGIDCTPQAVYPLIGRPLDVAMGELHQFGDDQDTLARVVAEYRENLLRAVDEAGDTLLLPGVHDMLERLRAEGFRVGVVTAKGAESAVQLMAVTGLNPFVEALVTNSDVERGKPFPDAALLGLERLGVAAEGAWYVGDATSDIEMAIAAGMRPMGITTGAATREALLEAGAEVVVDSAAEAAEFLLGQEQPEN